MIRQRTLRVLTEKGAGAYTSGKKQSVYTYDGKPVNSTCGPFGPDTKATPRLSEGGYL
jgi:hypothetical protein